MQNSTPFTGPYWASTIGENPVGYPSLSEDLEADVVVVGAGIVGLTAADALSRAGKSVVVVEALRVGTQVTARSTAKITSQHGLIYARLIRDYGEHNARNYAQANEQAINHIEELIGRTNIACAFERTPAYAYTRSKDSVKDLDDEAAAASKLGLPAQLTQEIGVPFPIERAVRFDHQAQFNPAQYLIGLAAAVATTARLFEATRVTKVEKESGNGQRFTVTTESGNRIGADDVIIATHLPIVPDGMFFTKAFTFSHPMIAAAIDPRKTPEGMFLSIDTPSHSFRVDSSSGTPYIVAVGGTFDTGVTDDEQRSVQELDRFLQHTFSIESPAYRWTNEDFQPMDGLPFIGSASSGSKRLYVATGFNSWGITNGTFAGTLLTDLIVGRDNSCAELFNASRVKPLVGGVEFVKGNLHSAKHFVADRLLASHPKILNLESDQAVIAKVDQQTVAAYRDEAGGLHTVSAICTHMGCVVGWNATDRSWDCPCHGSRFSFDGTVIHGPATSALKRISVSENEGENGDGR